MKKLIIAAALVWPFALALAQDSNPDLLDSTPGKQLKDEVSDRIQRPDSQKIMSELSSLRLSSKQEARITKAINKQTKDFDGLMKDYEKTSSEEKKWRYKMNDQHHELLKITQDVPNIIRDFLDDEQRQSYDDMLNGKGQPASSEEPSLMEDAPDGLTAPKPVKKRKVLKKKRLPTSEEAVAEEEPGQVMVDKEQGVRRQSAQKKRVLKKKPAAKSRIPAPEEDMMSDAPAGSKPTGKRPPADEEDAGSYP